MSVTRINRVLIDPAAADAELTERILAALPGVPRETVLPVGLPETPEPRSLFLTVNRGRWIKPFTDGGRDAYHLMYQTGCYFRCAYCYLRTYLERPGLLTVFVNHHEMEDEVTRLCRTRPGACSLYTGELSDSLMLDELTGFSARFMRLAASLPVRRFELRTKTDNVANLLTGKPADNFYVTFSLNPAVLAGYEAGAAPVEKRIAAMAACAEAGFKTGFHLDPMIRVPGWEDYYDGLLEKVFGTIRPEKVGYVSCGALRFKHELTDDLRTSGDLERYPAFIDEFYPGNDGKLRYYKPLRVKMLRHIRKKLLSYGLEGRIFISMEPQYVLDAVADDRKSGLN